MGFLGAKLACWVALLIIHILDGEWRHVKSCIPAVAINAVLLYLVIYHWF